MENKTAGEILRTRLCEMSVTRGDGAITDEEWAKHMKEDIFPFFMSVMEEYKDLHCADKQREIEELKKVLHLVRHEIKDGPYHYLVTHHIDKTLNPSPVK